MDQQGHLTALQYEKLKSLRRLSDARRRISGEIRPFERRIRTGVVVLSLLKKGISRLRQRL